MFLMKDMVKDDFWGMAMKRLYYEMWIPFAMNKKRILVLAIASYIALC